MTHIPFPTRGLEALIPLAVAAQKIASASSHWKQIDTPSPTRPLGDHESTWQRSLGGEDMSSESSLRIAALESRLRLILVVNGVLFVAVFVVLAASCRTTDARSSQPKTLTVSELNIVDPHGVVRVRVGGDLPDAVINGKRVPRGQRAAGVLLYDDTGQERGGYITFSPGRQVALTLDNRTSGQTATLIAGAEGGSALNLSYGNDLVELRVDDETGPSIHAVRGKQVAFHVPPVVNFQATEGCTELRAAMTKHPREQVLDWCRARVSEEACQACLARK